MEGGPSKCKVLLFINNVVKNNDCVYVIRIIHGNIYNFIQCCSVATGQCAHTQSQKYCFTMSDVLITVNDTQLFAFQYILDV